MQQKWLSVASAGIVAAGLLCGVVGCGGGKGGRTVATAVSTGRATLTVRWPERGRLIPFAAESIRVKLTSGGKLLGEALLTRPENGGTAAANFDRLPLGELTAEGAAYPNTEGAGIVQARAQTTATINADQVTPIRLTLASTINRVEVTPATVSLSVNGTASLAASAKNAAGETVFTLPATMEWRSRNAAVATVAAGGAVRGVSGGTAVIEVRETESNKVGTATVTVAAVGSNNPIAFLPPVSYEVGQIPGNILVADFDGDGNRDVAVSVYNVPEGNGVRILFGRGDGTLEAPVTVFTKVEGTELANQAADMNNDGRLDVVCTDGADKVHILFNTGNRTFNNRTFVTVGSIGNCDIGDFDNDGDEDIAVILPGSGPGGGVQIIRNNGNGTFTKTVSYGVPEIAIGVGVGDLNGDGKLDLGTTFTSSTVGWSGFTLHFGDGAGQFTGGGRYNTATLNVNNALFGDYNRDGKLDVAVNNYFDNRISVLFGNGDGTLQEGTTYAAEPYPLIIRTTDFNGDGWPDIVASNAGTSNFSVLRNLGTGLFADRVQYPSGGENTRGCDVGDLNNDGKPDVVFGCENSRSIVVHLNSTL